MDDSWESDSSCPSISFHRWERTEAGRRPRRPVYRRVHPGPWARNPAPHSAGGTQRFLVQQQKLYIVTFVPTPVVCISAPRSLTSMYGGPEWSCWLLSLRTRAHRSRESFWSAPWVSFFSLCITSNVFLGGLVLCQHAPVLFILTGVSRLMDLLADSREVIRNDVSTLLFCIETEWSIEVWMSVFLPLTGLAVTSTTD